MKPEFADHYKDLATFKATEDSRKLTLPQSADGYEVKLSDKFQAPQGVEFKLDPASAEAAHLRAWAHKHGLSQDAVSEVVDIYAGGQIGNQQMLRAARDAEVAKLGSAGSARVTAVQQFLDAQLGSEMGKVMGGMLVTAKHVEGFEKLLASFRTQGVGNFTPSRQPNEPARLSDEQVAKMTYSERKDYAAQFAKANGAAPH